jgi:hypothetical protein
VVSGGKVYVYARDEQLCGHHKRSSVRIYCAPPFHKFDDCSRRVQEDETLPEEVQVYDVAWDDSEGFKRRRTETKTDHSFLPNPWRATRVLWASGQSRFRAAARVWDQAEDDEESYGKREKRRKKEGPEEQ